MISTAHLDLNKEGDTMRSLSRTNIGKRLRTEENHTRKREEKRWRENDENIVVEEKLILPPIGRVIGFSSL